MDECLKESLVGSGIPENVIAILEDQQLTNCDLLEDVEMNILLLCGIKVGQAVIIKRVIKSFSGSSVINKVHVETKKEEHEKSNQQHIELFGDCVDIKDSCEDISQTTNGLSEVTKSPLQFQERRNIKFFDNFSLLDKFAPAVSTCLENKCLTGNERNEFVRDICTSIIANGIHYLSKAERNKVALEIVTTYPFLKDPIGSGLGSWSESIRNRFKHVRKYSRKRQAAVESPAKYPEAIASHPNCKPPKITRRMDFWNVLPNTQNSTNDIQAEHLSELIKETQRPIKNQDMVKIAELMKETYPSRRTEILTSAIAVKDIILKFPPLATINGIRHEFCRIMEDANTVKEMKQRFSQYQSAIIKYCEKLPRKTPYIKNALRSMQQMISVEPEKIETIECMCAVIVLPELLKRKSTIAPENHLIQFVSEDEDINRAVAETTFPKLIALGEDCLKLEVLFLCVEGIKLVDVSSLPLDTVLLTLHACYYVFSIQYPADFTDFFFFIDSVILGLQNKASNKIAVQKFTAAIKSLI